MRTYPYTDKFWTRSKTRRMITLTRTLFPDRIASEFVHLWKTENAIKARLRFGKRHLHARRTFSAIKAEFPKNEQPHE